MSFQGLPISQPSGHQRPLRLNKDANSKAQPIVELAKSPELTVTSAVHFGGKGVSEVPAFGPAKPKTLWGRIKAGFQAAAQWLNPFYVLQRLGAYIRKRKAKQILKQLEAQSPESVKKIMNEPPLAKINYGKVNRKTTGIAKASTYYDANHPVMKERRDYKGLGILESYGVDWSVFKVVRDAMQNFYDGQGQTLDGVKTEVKKSGSSKHKIKVSASANYDVEKLLYMGATTKEASNVTAGGFGEGAKMMALMLLRTYGSDKVTFRSREWQADFKLARPPHQTSGKRELMVKLTPLNPPIQGNELEFETTDNNLAETFQDKNRLFYNPKDEIFKDPLYENSTGGFKFLDGPGRVFEAGQLRAYENEKNYDAIPGLVLWSNQKVLDLKDRDRVAIHENDVQTIMSKVVSGMSKQQTAEGIQVLRNHWFYKDVDDLLTDKINRSDAKRAAEMMLKTLCRHYRILSDGKQPDFLPKGLVSVHPSSFSSGAVGQEQYARLLKSGYIPVKPALEELSVPSGEALILSQQALLEEKASKVKALTPVEQRRKDIMETSLRSLPNHFRSEAASGNIEWNGTYGKHQIDKLAQFSELPLDVVSLPPSEGKQGNTDSFMKISENNKRILVDRRVLHENSFPEMIFKLFTLAQGGASMYISDKNAFGWLLKYPNQWQQQKEKWEKKDA